MEKKIIFQLGFSLYEKYPSGSFDNYYDYVVGQANKECMSTNHEYNEHRPSFRLIKGVAK